MAADASQLLAHVIPAATMSPAACSEFAARLRGASQLLAQWGIRTARGSRVDEAIRRLEVVAESNSYGSTDKDLLKTSRSLLLASDLLQVARLLPNEKVDVLAAHMARVLDGSLDAQARDSEPSDLLAQYWFAMLFAKAGMPLGLPQGADRLPDFVVSVDTLDVAVEVKRPKKARSALRAMLDAASQLQALTIPGYVILDLSQVFASEDLIFDRPPRSPDVLAPLNQRFQALTASLERAARSYKRSNKFDRILGLWMLARICAWNRRSLDAPLYAVYVSAPVFEDACNGLVRVQAAKLRDRLTAGMAALAGNEPRPL